MTTRIEDQLHDYFAELEAQSTARGFRPKTDDGAAVAPVVVLDPFATRSREADSISRATWVAGAAAAVIALVVGLVAFTGGGDTTEIDPADQPSRSTPPAFGAAAAMAYVDAWYEAYDAADLAGLEAAYPPGDDAFVNFARDSQLHLAAWDLAQESTVTARGCDVVAETASDVTIRCEYDSLQQLFFLVGAEPIRVIDTFRVEPVGIVAVDDSWVHDWGVVNRPFEAWHAATYPDDPIVITYGTWESIEDAQRSGARRLELAREWAAWLDANGCVYDQPCEPAE